MTTNIYYRVPSTGVREVLAAASNLQPSARECCGSCHDLTGCSAFQW